MNFVFKVFYAFGTFQLKVSISMKLTLKKKAFPTLVINYCIVDTFTNRKTQLNPEQQPGGHTIIFLESHINRTTIISVPSNYLFLPNCTRLFCTPNLIKRHFNINEDELTKISIKIFTN